MAVIVKKITIFAKYLRATKNERKKSFIHYTRNYSVRT